MFFSISLLAISLSIDALGVGVVYGLKKIKIPLMAKIIICLFSIVYSGLALIAGKTLAHILPPLVAKLIGIVILGLMGTWIIIQALLKVHSLEKKQGLSKPSSITPVVYYCDKILIICLLTE